MKIILTNEESEKCFLDALCNGLHILTGDCNLPLHYNKSKYNAAAKKLSDPTFEDVLLQLLKDGGKIMLSDCNITIEDVHNRVSNTPPYHLFKVFECNGHGINAEVLLQYVFFNEEIYA